MLATVARSPNRPAPGPRNLDFAVPGRLRRGDGVVETARVQDPVGIKVIRLHPENTGEKEHVVGGHPNLARLDFADLFPCGEIHADDLRFDGELVLRPSPATAQPSNLQSYDVKVPHNRMR